MTEEATKRRRIGAICGRIRGISVRGVPYSEHSSFTELREFVKFLKPEKIIPTVNAGNAANRARMQSYFKEWLKVPSSLPVGLKRSFAVVARLKKSFAVAVGLKRSFAVVIGLKKSFIVTVGLSHLVRPGRSWDKNTVELGIRKLNTKPNESLYDLKPEELAPVLTLSIEFSFKEFEDPFLKSSSLHLYVEPVYDAYDNDMFDGVLDLEQPAYDNYDKSKTNVRSELFAHNVSKVIEKVEVVPPKAMEVKVYVDDILVTSNNSKIIADTFINIFSFAAWVCFPQ
ncbi:hypothetical protein KFK09_008447 [Dendrobium nobile]|uniref:DNA repair metallo-beta-lactamase domain-containing protein n=1 Tax=Dendrobium nobile TaxID=94219 RepID=A0A8T3BPZ8_DENNO|nr:hypothetical protein KFK09_008447 [Dendrobium nobile]